MKHDSLLALLLAIAAFLVPAVHASAASPSAVSPSVSPSGEAEADAVLEIYDLRPLMPRFDLDSSWSHSLMFPPGVRPSERETLDISGLGTDGDPTMIVEILMKVLGDELLYEGRRISLNRNGGLLVLAPAAVQEKVRATLAAIESALCGSVELAVDVVEFSGKAPEIWPAKNLLSADEAGRLLTDARGRGASHQRTRLSLTAGRTATLEQMRHFPILYDYDVEIAQGAFILDPLVCEIEEGLRIFLRGVPMGNGLALSLVFQTAEVIDGVRERPIDCRGMVGTEELIGPVVTDGPGAIQAVDLLHRSVALNTFLPEDAALVFASRVNLAGQERTQIVVLRKVGGSLSSYSTQRIAGTSRSLIAVNTESLSPPTIGWRETVTDYHPEGTHPLLTAVLDAEPSLFLIDWVRDRFSSWFHLGPWAIIVTDPAWDQGAAEELDLLLSKWRPADTLLGLDARLVSAGALENTPVQWSLPVRPGAGCGVVCGISSLAHWSYDVEVAQFSAAVDPLQVPIFNGFALRVRPYETGDGHTLDLAGIAQLRAGGPIAAFDPKYDLLGRLDQPVRDQLKIDERRVLPGAGGGPVLVGGEVTGGVRPALRLEIAVK
jgi:hypothetical protein